MEDETENAGFLNDVDSCCSTPYVSAPSSPTRGTHLAGFYYSAPSSPMHFVLSSNPSTAAPDSTCSFEFDFSVTLPSTTATSPEHMTSADELFFNGQIRPMKLFKHLERPQILDPLIESDEALVRGRDLKLRAGSLRRRTRSMSPMRSQTPPFRSGEIHDDNAEEEGKLADETTACASRSSSAGRSSKRWVFLKEFLSRSKSEGRNEGQKFWSFSPMNKEKKLAALTSNAKVKEGKKKRVIPASAHELHYRAKRAQAEELRKKTFLPYRPGVLGCLGFSSKAMNGFAKAFTSV